MPTATVGTGGDYTSLTSWANAIKGLATDTYEAVLISDLNSGQNLNYTMSPEKTLVVRSDGTRRTITANSVTSALVVDMDGCVEFVLEDVNLNSNAQGANTRALDFKNVKANLGAGEGKLTVRRCKMYGGAGAASTFRNDIYSGVQALFEDCIFEGGTQGAIVYGTENASHYNDYTFKHCAFVKNANNGLYMVAHARNTVVAANCYAFPTGGIYVSGTLGTFRVYNSATNTTSTTGWDTNSGNALGQTDYETNYFADWDAGDYTLVSDDATLWGIDSNATYHTTTDFNGATKSNNDIGPIESSAPPPTVTQNEISGTAEIGETLTCVSDSSDPGATPTYQWYAAQDNLGTGETALGTASTQALTCDSPVGALIDAQGNAYVRVDVVYTNGAGPSATDASDYVEVTLPTGGGNSNPIGSPCNASSSMPIPIGDVPVGSTISFSFLTVDPATKAPATLTGTPAVGVWKDGVKMTLDSPPELYVDKEDALVGASAVTGKNWVVIDMTADADYTAGSEYEAHLTAGEVNGTSLVGEPIAKWSCDSRRAAGIKDGAISPTTFAENTLSSIDDLVKKFGVALEIAADPAPTTTTFSVVSAQSLTNTQIDNALVLYLPSGAYSRLTDITGVNCTISPALPEAPEAGEVFVVFAKYLASL